MILQKLVRNAVNTRLRKLRGAPGGSPAALVFGVGNPAGIGAAVASRLAHEGLPVYVGGRSPDKLRATVEAINAGEPPGSATALTVDALDATTIRAACERVRDDGHVLDLVVFNVGTNRPGPFLKLSAEQLEKSWRADCLAAFSLAQAALEQMQPRGCGTLIFTGASASLRGRAGFASFAAAKAGLRSLAQALAREFGPQGIHVAHVIIDGMVDGERLRSRFPEMLNKQGPDGCLQPEAIAECYWQLYQQHRTAWTHELDLRPYKENW